MSGRPLTGAQIEWYQDYTDLLKKMTDATRNAAYKQIAGTKGVKRDSLEVVREAEVALTTWVVTNPYPEEKRKRNRQ